MKNKAINLAADDAEQESALRLFRIMLKASRALAAHSQASTEAMGFCPTDFYILEALYHKGSLTAGQLAQKVLITLGSLTTALDRLEARGLVQRKVDGGDRRMRTVHLTKAGEKLVAENFPDHAAVLLRAMGGLTAAEMNQAAELLKRLGLYAAANISS